MHVTMSKWVMPLPGKRGERKGDLGVLESDAYFLSLHFTSLIYLPEFT